MKHSVKFFTLLFLFCINCFFLKAQQKHFIYMQSEDKQPFAVVLNGKVFSSSDYGYVIIPKLVDSTYNFTVSFPMNKFPDQAFTCAINKKDAGYMLKNETNGWALQDMQTQKLITNNSNTTAQKNGFGDMLSDVVNDSDLVKKDATLQKPADATNAAAVTLAAISVETVAANNRDAATDVLAKPQKISESKIGTGTNMLFVDKTKDGVDTISVFVPFEAANADLATDQKSLQENSTNNLQNETLSVTSPPHNSDSVSGNNISSASENVAVNNNEHTQDVSNPFYKPEQSINNTAVTSAAATGVVSTTNAVKQDCENTISDDDLNKLKRKMFVKKNDNDMIQYAVKYMDNKCITTDQVKSLGNLFSSDDGRYNLYDALYNYTYDYGNYPGLSTQILDPYYKKRFAALLR